MTDEPRIWTLNVQSEGQASWTLICRGWWLSPIETIEVVEKSAYDAAVEKARHHHEQETILAERCEAAVDYGVDKMAKAEQHLRTARVMVVNSPLEGGPRYAIIEKLDAALAVLLSEEYKP